MEGYGVMAVDKGVSMLESCYWYTEVLILLLEMRSLLINNKTTKQTNFLLGATSLTPLALFSWIHI